MTLPWCQSPPGPGRFEDYVWSFPPWWQVLCCPIPPHSWSWFLCPVVSHAAYLAAPWICHPPPLASFCYSAFLPLGCLFSTGSRWSGLFRHWEHHKGVQCLYLLLLVIVTTDYPWPVCPVSRGYQICPSPPLQDRAQYSLQTGSSAHTE